MNGGSSGGQQQRGDLSMTEAELYKDRRKKDIHNMSECNGISFLKESFCS